MPLNIRFIMHGAIVAFVFMTIISSLDDVSKLVIVCGLIAVSVIIEQRTPKP
jgi:hypothetical protein